MFFGVFLDNSLYIKCQMLNDALVAKLLSNLIYLPTCIFETFYMCYVI